MIEISINGDPYKLKNSLNLVDLLKDLKLDPMKVAIERNREIVPKTTYSMITLEQDDQLEIVHFIGGGK